MEIVTPEFSISQEKDQTLDLHIAKEENGEMLVKNDGDKVTVKTKNSENKTEVKQISSELVAINSSSDMINHIEDQEVMIDFMAKNNISATFTLSTEDVQWPEIKRDEPNNLVAMETKEENKQVVQNT
jgi:alpha-amylase/alpha-mannosidase (GH57 family)